MVWLVVDLIVIILFFGFAILTRNFVFIFDILIEIWCWIVVSAYHHELKMTKHGEHQKNEEEINQHKRDASQNP
jgi:hypothetical protein